VWRTADGPTHLKFIRVLAGKAYPVLWVFHGSRVDEALPSALVRESVMKFSPPLLISEGVVFGVPFDRVFFFFTLKLAPLRGTMCSFFGSDTVRIQEAVMSQVVDRHSDPSPSPWTNAGKYLWRLGYSPKMKMTTNAAGRPYAHVNKIVRESGSPRRHVPLLIVSNKRVQDKGGLG